MAPISSVPAPSAASRSGASTSTTPNASPASRVSHRPPAARGLPRAGSAARRPCGSGGAGLGTKNAVPIRMTPATAAAANAGPVPTWPATTPTTGPNSAPTTAAPSAMPSSSPRRSDGAEVAIQAIAAAQVHAPARPWTNRAASSATADEAKPKTSVDTLIMASPSTATTRSPNRAVSRPPGSAPISVPSGYIATRMPAPALDSPARCL